ncbi:MAG: translocation/assembly module TamB domain-containing protein [Candidatus Aminicenantales bacterium]
MKKTARRIIVFAVLCVGFLLLFIHLPFVRKAVLDRALQAAERNLGVELKASSLRYNLFRLEFSLRAVSLSSPGEPDLPPLLTAERIHARIPLSLLFGKKIHVKELHIQAPKISIFKDENGRTNIPRPPSSGDEEPAGASPSLPEIIIGRFLAQDIAFSYVDLEAGIEIETAGGRLEVGWLGRGTHSLTLDLGRGATAEFQGKRIPVERFDLRADIGREETLLHNAAIRSGPSELSLSGRVRDYFHPLLGLGLQGHLFLDDLKTRLHLPQDISGTVDFKSRLEGSLQALSARAELFGENLGYEELRGLTLQSELRWQDKTLTVASMRISAPEGELQGSARFHPFDRTAANQVELTLDALDPARLLERLDLPVDISTRASGSLRFSWTGPTLDSLFGRADIEFSSPTAAATPSLPAAVPLSGKAGLEADAGKIKVILDRVHLGDTSLGGSFESAAGRLWGKFSLDIQDIGSLLSSLPPSVESLVAGHVVTSSLRGRLSLSGEVGGRLTKPLFKAELTGREISLAGVEGLGLEGDFAFDGEEVLFQSLTVTLDEGRAMLDGAFRLRSPQPLDLGLRIRQWPMGSILAALGIAEDVAAELNLDARVSGGIETPVFGVEGRLSRTRFRGRDVGDLPFEARSDGRTVEFEARAPSLAVSGQGAVALAAPHPLRLRIDFESLSLDRVADLAMSAPPPGIAATASGRADLSVELGRPAETTALDLRISAFSLGTKDFRLAGAREFSISYSHQGLSIRNLLLENGRNRLQVEGSLPWRGDAEAGLSVSAALDLGSLAWLLPVAAGQGRLAFEARLEGSISTPRFRAEFSRFEIDLPWLQLIQEAPSRILFDRDRVVFERFSLAGGDKRFQAAGTLGLAGEKELDLNLMGDLDLRMLQAFVADPGFSGRTAYEIGLTGSLARPEVAGFIELHDAGFDAPEFNLSLSRLNGRLLLLQNRLEVEGFDGLLNGGKVKAGGSLVFDGLSLKNSDLQISGEDIFLRYPKGFFAETGFALRFALQDEKPTLGGVVTIQAAQYVEPFNVQSELYRYLKRRPRLDQDVELPPLFRRLNFDIQVVIRDGIFIRNNLARAEVLGDLKLSGTPLQPALTGRVVVGEGGEIYFSQTTYRIEQGRVDFVNPNRIEPDVDVRAQTRVAGYDILLLLSGTPDKFSAGLTSEPPLSEPDIISLLVTGKRLAYVSDDVLGAIGGRALSYLDDALTGKLENLVQQKLGLDSVTIDAGLVSSQENPEARLTVGQHITPELELVLSQSLKNSQNTTAILNYKPRREINLRAAKHDDDSYRFDIQREVRFGLPGEPAPLQGRREGRSRLVGSLVLEGNLGLDERTVRRSLKLSPGKRFDVVRYHDDLDRLRRLYEKNDYLSHFISAKKDEIDGGMDLVYRIESGPKIRIGYEGAEIPASLKRKVRALWTGGKLRGLAGDDVREEIRRHFCRQGYYKVEVRLKESSGAGGERVVTFQVVQGIRYRKLEIDFRGVGSLSPRSLTGLLKKSGLLKEIFVSPQAVTRGLEGYYRQRGFLLAQAGPPEIGFDRIGRTVRATFAVDEGPRFKVGRIEFRGNLGLGEDVLAESVRLETGAVFSPQVYEAALGRLGEVYARRGYNEAEIEGESRLDKERAVADLAFKIAAKRQDIVNSIEVSGNAVTRERVVLRELAFGVGDPLDHYAVNRSRKKLYDLGIFGRVQFTLKPEDEEAAGARRLNAVKVEVTELHPFSLRYGLQYDTETEFGVAGELVNRNVLGASRLAGASFNLNRYEKGAKAFFRSHYFLGKKINSEFFAFLNRKILPGYTVDKSGLTLQQQIKFLQSWMLSYNYTFERSRTYDGAVAELEVSEEAVNVGRLNATVSANTRDDVVNPSRGTFFSQSLDYAASALGSEVRFWRYFGQYFFIRRVTGPVDYALGLRLGLGKGIGGDLPLGDRFFAGGGTSIRGFGYNEVGPKSQESRIPLGGEALFILNQELRFSLYRALGGVLFLDIGTVYTKAGDFKPIETRETAGVGLRFATSIVLLRVDWGFKLDRRPGESRSEVHFSIGQAF